MTSKEERYSAYGRLQQTLIHADSILAGFTFTAITLLLTRFPDPANIAVQIALFMLTILLDMFLLELAFSTSILMICVKTAPKLPAELSHETRTGRALVLVSDLTHVLFSYSVVIMFLLWNLINLAAVCAATNTLFLVIYYRILVKALSKHHREYPYTKV